MGLQKLFHMKPVLVWQGCIIDGISLRTLHRHPIPRDSLMSGGSIIHRQPDPRDSLMCGGLTIQRHAGPRNARMSGGRIALRPGAYRR